MFVRCLLELCCGVVNSHMRLLRTLTVCVRHLPLQSEGSLTPDTQSLKLCERVVEAHMRLFRTPQCVCLPYLPLQSGASLTSCSP